MNNFIKRTLTGIIFVIILMSGLINQYSFLVIFSLITALLLWEFYGLLNKIDDVHIQRGIACVTGLHLFISTWLYTNSWTNSTIFLPYILLLMGCLIGELYYKAPNPIINWAYTLLGQFYCAGSIALLNLIFNQSFISESWGGSLFALALFIFIWLNDTGAYLVGSAIGHKRLFERISPKKSWEGFWGGWIITLIAAYIISRLPFPNGNPLNLQQWLGFATTVVIFGTWGDLLESLLKRTLHIKDSGNIIPGHGGILDRFDSVLLAIPAIYIFLEIFTQS